MSTALTDIIFMINYIIIIIIPPHKLSLVVIHTDSSLLSLFDDVLLYFNIALMHNLLNYLIIDLDGCQSGGSREFDGT